MRTDLSPTHIKSIDQIVILWFARSNKYVIVSKFAYKLLKKYLKSDTPKAFTEQLIISRGFARHEAIEVSEQFSNLVTLANENTLYDKNKIERLTELAIPKNEQPNYYNFANRIIQVNYGSKKIKTLFDPQLQHCHTNEIQKECCVFDIFTIGDALYLFKNRDFIYSIFTKDYHLMQGRFAMELTNELHQKNSDDWLATFHASTIADGSEAVMVVGDSGKGKSTLSALLMINGFQLLADDFTPLYAEDLKLYRYPNAISVKKGAFGMLEKEYPEFSKLETHYNGAKSIGIKYLPPFGDSLKEKSSLPCSKIVAVSYNSKNPSSFQKTTPEDILATLIPDSWISPHPEHAKKFLNWLENVEFYNLEYNSNDFAIKSFKSIF